jgi:glutathione S-transferase
VQVLEARYPQLSVYGKYAPGMSNAIMTWAEDQFFWPAARYITGVNADHVHESLHSDRAAMRGNHPPDLERVKKAASRNLPEMHIQFEWVQDVLSRTKAYILGDEISLADLAVYHGIWFLGVFKINALDLVEPYPDILPWMKRVEQLGHGVRKEFSAEEALGVAKLADPAPLPQSISDAVAPPLGSQVTMQPLDYGSDPVQGELVYLGRNHVTLRRETGSELGTMAVHFPRMQYMLRAVR